MHEDHGPKPMLTLLNSFSKNLSFHFIFMKPIHIYLQLSNRKKHIRLILKKTKKIKNGKQIEFNIYD
jgi:hypothetical protein